MTLDFDGRVACYMIAISGANYLLDANTARMTDLKSIYTVNLVYTVHGNKDIRYNRIQRTLSLVPILKMNAKFLRL